MIVYILWVYHLEEKSEHQQKRQDYTNKNIVFDEKISF